jgi:hypothetical protein
MGRAGHARARRVFGLDRMVSRYDALFRSLLDAPPRRLLARR